MNTPLTRTTREMKKHNVVLVVNALKALNSATKADLSAQTGLSVATCGTVLNDLCLTGEVLALALDASSGGRPAQRYAYNPDFFSVLSLYVEGNNASARIAALITSATGEALEQLDAPLQPFALEHFFDAIRGIVSRYPNLQAMGIGLPGVIVDGVVASCDIALFEHLPLVQILQEKFGLFVQVGNDMNYTAYGFYRSNCPQETGPVAYLLQPEGECTGCGMVINGRVLQGASHFAGEVSHLPLAQLPGSKMIERLGDIIVTLVAVVNPVTVALSGPQLNALDLADIRRHCQSLIPKQHLPALIYRPSIEQDYLQGIAELTLESYSFHLTFEL
ncbi:hypothetical protein AwEntero_23200 [Enterobacterales bacterium]|nr:hypothetical protein AwEntero_23200 [Enterobacterales bacterium]